MYQGDSDGLSCVSKVERTLVEVWRAETSWRIVGGTDRLPRDAYQIVIELVVTIEVFIDADSIGRGREIGINAEILRVKRDRKKAVAERLIAIARKSRR